MTGRQTVAIVDYGSGNLRSAAKAFERACHDRALGFDIVVSGDAEVVRKAERIVLPGVGAFADCRAGLDRVPGMVDALTEAVIGKGRPFLGICVGMQLMADEGFEHGRHAGLGWIAGAVQAIRPADAALKIPHMGWNALDIAKPHPLLAGVAQGAHAYFVHSFGFAAADPGHVIARVDYGGPIVAVIGRDNLAGTQFHPEKSQAAGLAVIGNFLAWRP